VRPTKQIRDPQGNSRDKLHTQLLEYMIIQWQYLLNM